MNTDTLNTSTTTGTLGGTLLVLLLQINWESMAQTAIIAAVGATTSFWISIGWRWISRRVLKRREKEGP
ncbi:MAG: hypothetical protein EOO88_57995 [Pedobacter sp.]|nr:MAG: hypothetical protein EOO88_57995 [Pedobacter sp.]